MDTKMLNYIAKNKDYVVSLLSDLIAIPTVNPPGENYEDMVSRLEKECKKLNLHIQKHVTPQKLLHKHGITAGSKRISLVADWLTGARETLHIASHYDVVPGTNKWRYDPFKAVIRENRIYGRGTEDMKGNIACVLFAVRAIREFGMKPKVNLQLSFAPDEEIGGATGLGYLVGRNLVKADYVMSEGYSDDYVSIGNKGVLWGEVTVEGKAAHASVPHKGVNAFERMVELANELKKLKKKISRRRTRCHMRDACSKSPTFIMGGMMEGGGKVNIVPGAAKFSIDRRLIPEEDALTAKKEILKVIERFNKKWKDSSVSIKFTGAANPSISKKDRLFFKTVSNSIKMVNGKKAKFCLMPGATDIRYFMWKGIPAVGYSAKGGESWHSDNEFVYIDSLVDTAKVYALVMLHITETW